MFPLSHHIFRPSIVSVVHCEYIDCQKYNFQCLLSQVQRINDISSYIFGNIFYIIHTVVRTLKPVQYKNISKNTTFRGISHAYIYSVWVSKPCVCTFQENQGEKLLTKLKLTGTYCGLSIRVRKFSPDSFLIIIKRRARDRS